MKKSHGWSKSMGSIDCNESCYERTFSEVEEVLAMNKGYFTGR